MTGRIERARGAFERQGWAEAYERLSGTSGDDPLGPEDLERLAISAYLVGKDDESAEAWERAHLEFLRVDDRAPAAECAFWLGLGLLLRGEMARAGGWLARARRIVEQRELDCVARGYLLVTDALEALGSGDAVRAFDLSREAGEIAERFGDRDLLALAWLGEGEAWIALGETTKGVRQFDEVMVAVTTGELSPIPAGLIYCAVIEACLLVFDTRRAAAWTDALSRWCEDQSELVAYRGQCLVHRSQVLQSRGEWVQAASDAKRARERLSQPPHPALGIAFYQQAELHRLRGDFDAAEDGYRSARRSGREPMPGLALLRLATGQVDAAAAAIRRAVGETDDPLGRPWMLAACVEIMLEAGEVPAARAASDELVKIAVGLDAPLVHAIAGHTVGAVLLAEGEAGAALAALRQARTTWQELAMPYETACSSALIGLACRALDDEETAELELGEVRAAFERLGALPDLARVAKLTPQAGRRATSVLTSRECEVLRLVAAGSTNREIAAELVISEHTVGRHLQNTFTKLGIRSRAAATAYAYEHGIV